ncbi:hypothetical protein VN97_g10504 [Penicillium thymicola]|uniref:Uncharacterized protein n=1 Tax=Penicillium thymicola TaxID=293382 RepID=A0AAI9T9P4_PENTH|nr:hypothetical protein VN97_g10504 [Penicillium thymicola]
MRELCAGGILSRPYMGVIEWGCGQFVSHFREEVTNGTQYPFWYSAVVFLTSKCYQIFDLFSIEKIRLI